MQAAIKHYPLTTNQSEMFQEWEEDTKMTQFNICGYYSVYSVCSVDYLFSTEDTDGHGGGLTKTKTITFNGGRVVSASCLSP